MSDVRPLFGAKPTATQTALPPVIGETTVSPLPQLIQQPVVSRSLMIVSDDMIDKIGQGNANVAADFSRKMLVHVKASDVDVLGPKLNELVSTAKRLDPKRFQGGMLNGLKNIFGNFKEKMMAEYDSVDERIKALLGEIQKVCDSQKVRVVELDQLFVLNEQTHTNYGKEIEQVDQMIASLQEQLAQEKAIVNPDGFAAQRVRDIQDRIDRAEQKRDNLRRGQVICLNLAPQIRLMQQNARSLIQGLNDAVEVTVPAWSNAFFLYIINLEQKKGAAIKNAVHDATDEAFKMQADLLRQNTADIARANQRSVVSIETLEHMQKQLMGSMDDLQKITEEGKKTRADAAPKLQQMETELIKKFLQ